MNNSAADPIADIANEYLEPEFRDRKLLTLLLEKYFLHQERILVQKTEMGETQAYVGSVTLEWFAGRVHFASCLPLLQQKLQKLQQDTDTK